MRQAKAMPFRWPYGIFLRGPEQRVECADARVDEQLVMNSGSSTGNPVEVRVPRAHHLFSGSYRRFVS